MCKPRGVMYRVSSWEDNEPADYTTPKGWRRLRSWAPQAQSDRHSAYDGSHGSSS